MLFDLTGKVCFVTGGAQPGSIGEKSCIALAENGAKVAIADIQAEGCERVAAEIRAKGGEAIGIGMNLASNDSIQAAVEKTVEAFGGIDVVVGACEALLRVDAGELAGLLLVVGRDGRAEVRELVLHVEPEHVLLDLVVLRKRVEAPLELLVQLVLDEGSEARTCGNALELVDRVLDLRR